MTTTADLPFIDATHYYTTEEAAQLLLQQESTLRKWRRESRGPKYYQAEERGSVKYLGQWLIEYRNAAIKAPAEL